MVNKRSVLVLALAVFLLSLGLGTGLTAVQADGAPKPTATSARPTKVPSDSARIQKLEQEVADLKALIGQHLGPDANQGGVNYPHPNQKVNTLGVSSTAFWNIYGLQFVESADAALYPPRIVWPGAAVPSYNTPLTWPGAGFSLGANIYSQFPGSADITYARSSSEYVGLLFALDGVAPDIRHIRLQMLTGGVTYTAGIYQDKDTPYVPAFRLSNLPLAIAEVTSDFATMIDGTLFYRGDLDAFRVRANGITRNLSDDGDWSTKTLATDAITITTSRHKVDTQAAAATDDMSTINGGNDGQILILQAANAARTVVAKDGVGNLRLNGDFSMDNSEDVLVLVKNGSTWYEVSRSDNGA